MTARTPEEIEPAGYATKAYIEAFSTLPPDRVKDLENSDEWIPIFLPRQLAEARAAAEQRGWKAGMEKAIKILNNELVNGSMYPHDIAEVSNAFLRAETEIRSEAQEK